MIEDDPYILTSTAEILTSGGFRILAGKNGFEGMAFLEREKPDLILCDVMMPGMDGYDFLQNIREKTETRDIPFIFVSAKVASSDIEKGMALGAADYLTKPFTMKQLLAAVQFALKQG